MSSSKICKKCKKSLPMTEFYKHAFMGDGHLSFCKSCVKKRVTKHRNKNVERIRAYDRDRSKHPDRIKLAAVINKRWRNEDSRRTKCHNAVARAVRNGLLIRLPCKVCGSNDSVAHHESYDEPLKVMWLCEVHHKKRHKYLALKGIET